MAKQNKNRERKIGSQVIEKKSWWSEKKNRSRFWTALILLILLYFFIVNNTREEPKEGPYPPGYQPQTEKTTDSQNQR
jgi:hypothetical protein